MGIKGIIEGLKKKGKLWIILLGAVAGVVLLLMGGGGGENVTELQSGEASLAKYAEETEKKIHDICSKVDGVSSVSVAVSFESGFEYVYAKNDGRGDLLVIGSGSSESAVKVTEKTPVIGGIGIVCRGGGDPRVQKKLLDLLSAAFGVSSDKIYITEAQK